MRSPLYSALLFAIALACTSTPAYADKLRDLVDVSGARGNQLIGYGIVGGVAGTGDDFTVPFAG